MNTSYRLMDAQMERLKPFFPKGHGMPRVDDPLPSRALLSNVPRWTKLHAVTDAKSRPIQFFMSAGPVSDCKGAAALLAHLPKADWMLADRGDDADWFREALKGKGIRACIPC